MLAMLNAAETRELPDTCFFLKLPFPNELDAYSNTFMVYPLRLAPVHAKISANGATVYLLLAAIQNLVVGRETYIIHHINPCQASCLIAL